MRFRLTTLAALGLCLTLAAPASAQAPGVVVAAPTNGAVVAGSSVTVRYATSSLALVRSPVQVEEAGRHPEANVAGQGHVHLTLDLWPLVMLDREEPYTFANVPPGEHQLTVELVGNDHSPLNPPVVQVIRFRTVAAPAMPFTGGAGSLRLAGALLVGAALAAGVWTPLHRRLHPRQSAV
jgi:hypothetical protein